MNKFIYSIPLALALACDPAAQEPEQVEFRGNPEVLYLTQYEADIDLIGFAKMVASCDGIEKVKLAATWTAYPQENPFVAGPRVLGFGFSTMAHDALIDCYETLMLDLGAHPGRGRRRGQRAGASGGANADVSSTG